ncbi:Crp/Fnr family transcriptional regulator [Pedobacter gandavensis]|uniref:Crp/Fnr family transcriptional regulator n=1 Tax=Pedobacter gandavensis TaxID=2679963 RepID=UPI0029314BF2|nr:Crp/Fnr family transcriptional regulator [Pedobacter gandavensis]
MNFDISKYHFKSDTLFKSVLPVYMDELKGISKLAKLKKGEELYREGSMPKAVYLVKKGKIKIQQTGADGKSRIVYIYTVGECFGFRPILCNEKHPVSAFILEDSEIEIFNGRGFLDIAKRSPNLSFNLVEILSFEFNVWINLIGSLSHKSTKERIALILLILNEKYRSAAPEPVITLSKSDIASYSETTEETVVRVLTFFKEQHIISNEARKVIIKNRQLLEIIAEGF